MNKRVLVAVVVLTVVIVGAVAALSFLPAVQQVAAPKAIHTVPSATPTPTETLGPGAYVAYSADAVPAQNGRTFVFFYAPWCGQCRDIDAGILAQGVPDGVTIFKADFDTEQALEQHYGVTMRTTFLELDKKGHVLKRFVAYDTPTFDAVIAAMF